MGPKDLTPQLPELEWARVPESHRYLTKFLVDCNYLQTLEGDIDSTHAAFLHSYLNPRNRGRVSSLNSPLGSQQRPLNMRWHRVSVSDTDYGLMFGFRRAMEKEDEGEDYSWHITHWLMPSYALVAAGGPGVTMRCNVRIPIDDEHFRFFRVQWNPDRPLTAEELSEFKHGTTFEEHIPGTYLPRRNIANDFLIDRELQKSWNFTGIRSIPEQDQAVTISMGTIVDRSKENLGTSDTAIVAMRRKLMKAARDLMEGTEPYSAHHGESYCVRQLDVLLKKDVPFDAAKELVKAPL
jgi:hypothetical protein